MIATWEQDRGSLPGEQVDGGALQVKQALEPPDDHDLPGTHGSQAVLVVNEHVTTPNPTGQ